MLNHFKNKKNFIKQKIFEIYNIKINETHILFIIRRRTKYRYN